MTSGDKSQQGPVLVAVAFDDQTAAVAATAVSLARQCRVPLHFLHVAEPPLYESMALETPGYFALPPLIRAEEDRTLTERRRSMDALLARLDPAAAATGAVVQGDSVRMIISEAVAKRASLIITASHPEAYRLMPSGFSTALSLMHEAPLPVLVLTQAASLDFSKEAWHILVADDLREATREAVRKAYELASKLPHSVVRQVHVHGDVREMLRDAWHDVRAHTPFRQQQELSDLSSTTPQSPWSREYDARRQQLQQHGEPWRSDAAAHGVTAELDVRTGDVAQEIHQVSEDFAPDLMVFGRHKTLHIRPFLVGRMPLKAMLKEQRAVLVVPPAAELYARLPFPG